MAIFPKMKPLVKTNRHLRRKSQRDKLLARFIISSTAIEGVRLKKEKRCKAR